MKPTAANVAILGEDYDVPGWLRDRFGFDTEAHYVGTNVSIQMDARDAVRVHFDMKVTRADLIDLFSRRNDRSPA